MEMINADIFLLKWQIEKCSSKRGGEIERVERERERIGDFWSICIINPLETTRLLWSYIYQSLDHDPVSTINTSSGEYYSKIF